jgi:hypothetical protein
MKHFFSKITATLIAVLVLISTFSFTVEAHYCGNFLMDVSFTGDAKDCGMMMDGIATTKKKNCCKDELHRIEGQDKLQHSSVDNLDFEKKQFLTAFFVSYTDLFSKITSEKSYYKDFSPPDTPLNYQVLYQTFLI